MLNSELDNSHSLAVYVGTLSSQDLIETLTKLVGKNGLRCIEKLGQTSLRVYFDDSVDITMLLDRPIVVKDRELWFFPVDANMKTVFVKGLPFNVPEKSLVDVITTYGKVRSIGYERYAGYKPLCTGTRVVKMKLDRPIPNFIRVGSFTAVVAYRNQKMVCRRCGGDGHLAKICNTPREDFQPGFPVHIRPVASGRSTLKTVNQPSSSKCVNAAVQTDNNILNDAATAAGENVNPVQVSTSKKVSSVFKVNGPRLETPSRSPASSSSHIRTSPTTTESQSKDKNCDNEDLIQNVDNEEDINLNVPTGACAKVADSQSLAVGDINTVPNVTETNETLTTSKKKKKKKKQKLSHVRMTVKNSANPLDLTASSMKSNK